MVKQVFVPTGVATTKILVCDRLISSQLDAIVFVVDSADTDRIPIAKTELMAILNVDSLNNIIID